jgi:hypothetical protein
MMPNAHNRFSLNVGLVCLLAAVASLILPSALNSQAPTSTKPAESQPTPILPRGKKLYLKDGTFHLVREYKVAGDRVRYYSVERSSWEEIPIDIVDWDMTREAETLDDQQNAALIDKVHKDEAARKELVDVDASVEIAPGLFLPEGEGLFLLDHLNVALLKQSDTDITFNKKQFLKQVLSPVPIVPTRHTVSILGARSKLRLTNGQPEFYRRSRDEHEPEIFLIHARVHGDKREIENIDTLFNTDVTKRNTISIETWELVKGVYRLTLPQALPPGEYAFAEVAKPDDQALYVWDFAIDPPPAKK